MKKEQIQVSFKTVAQMDRLYIENDLMRSSLAKYKAEKQHAILTIKSLRKERNAALVALHALTRKIDLFNRLEIKTPTHNGNLIQ